MPNEPNARQARELAGDLLDIIAPLERLRVRARCEGLEHYHGLATDLLTHVKCDLAILYAAAGMLREEMGEADGE